MRGFIRTAKLGVLALAVFGSSLFAAEPPYKEGELRSILTVTAAQRRASWSDLERFSRAKRQPGGGLLEYYDLGSTNLDMWLSYSLRLAKTPPANSPSYYRFVYRDGYPIADYRHDDSGAHLSKSYYYDQRSFPMVSVQFDKEGKPLTSCLLVYDNTDRIKRVMLFNAAEELVRVVCFRRPSGSGELEAWSYGMNGKDKAPSVGVLVLRYLYLPTETYRIENEERIRGNGYTRAAIEASQAKHGIRPFYPVP